MIRATAFAGKRVAVFGLGGSGLACVRALADGGADVSAWDDGEKARANAVEAGARLVNLAEADWTAFDLLVLAPGVPLTHPEPHWTVKRAKDAGVEIIGDVEIFFRERALVCPQAPVIAITGTNGKSTTTALTAHVLERLGCDVQMGGNIGKAILTLEPPTPDRFYVVELSSYQIDLTPTLNPTVGVVLNVTPDHLDRHGTLEAYAAIKERLAVEAEVGAIAIDDDITRDMARRLEPTERLYAFTAGKGAAMVPSLYAIGSSLFVHEREGTHASSRQIGSLEGIGSLRGRHNVQNTLAALTALRGLQDRLDAAGGGRAQHVWRPEEFQDALASFPGLAHRMEEVGTVGRAVFINDSKATNAEAAEKALSSFDDGIFWIAGGVPKAGGIEPLRSYFPRIARAYLIGEATEAFAQTLDGAVDYVRCANLAAAVRAAANDAGTSGSSAPVVLLSPACASFDQFKNFELRGDAFRSRVKALTGFVARASKNGGAG